ncbi:hypothetical protein ACVIW0_004779 [Bradyrhizobium sp. USDA 4454]
MCVSCCRSRPPFCPYRLVWMSRRYAITGSMALGAPHLGLRNSRVRYFDEGSTPSALVSDGVHKDARDPYFLYAVSNAGSLLALLAYPLLIEPELSLDRQSAAVWTVGYHWDGLPRRTGQQASSSCAFDRVLFLSLAQRSPRWRLQCADRAVDLQRRLGMSPGTDRGLPNAVNSSFRRPSQARNGYCVTTTAFGSPQSRTISSRCHQFRTVFRRAALCVVCSPSA